MSSTEIHITDRRNFKPWRRTDNKITRCQKWRVANLVSTKEQAKKLRTASGKEICDDCFSW